MVSSRPQRHFHLGLLETAVKTSELLTKAKPFLWDGTNKGWGTDIRMDICYATRSAEAATLHRLPKPSKAEARAAYKAARIARRHIHNALSPHDTLTDWLRDNVPEARNASAVQLQAYRLRWLNHLISHFKAKGD